MMSEHCSLTRRNTFLNSMPSPCRNEAGINYSGPPLIWTPWAPGKVSCIERCPYFRGKVTLRMRIGDIAKCLYTEVSLFRYYRGVL